MAQKVSPRRTNVDRHDIEAMTFQRITGCQASGSVSRDHQKPDTPKLRQEFVRFGQQFTGSSNLQSNGLLKPDCRLRQRQIFLFASRLRHVVCWQVDTATQKVLGHVLAMFDDLKSGTDRIRQPNRPIVRTTEDAKDQLANGVRGTRTGLDQLLPGRNIAKNLITTIRFDQTLERFEPQAMATYDGCELPQDRILRLGVTNSQKICREFVELRPSIAQSRVAHLIHKSRIGIERKQIAPQRTREPPQNDWEVLTIRARKDHIRREVGRGQQL